MNPYEYNKFSRDHPIISDIRTMYKINLNLYDELY